MSKANYVSLRWFEVVIDSICGSRAQLQVVSIDFISFRERDGIRHYFEYKPIQLGYTLNSFISFCDIKY